MITGLTCLPVEELIHRLQAGDGESLDEVRERLTEYQRIRKHHARVEIQAAAAEALRIENEKLRAEIENLKRGIR